MTKHRLHTARYVADVGGTRYAPGDFLADVSLGDGITPELLSRALQSGFVVLEVAPPNEQAQPRKRGRPKKVAAQGKTD